MEYLEAGADILVTSSYQVWLFIFQIPHCSTFLIGIDPFVVFCKNFMRFTEVFISFKENMNGCGMRVQNVVLKY